MAALTDPAPTRPSHGPDTPEHRRLGEAARDEQPWKRWGPYLSERQWGTVREDYSPHGTAWDYFPHDHARSRAYRWGDDGLLGITDDQGLLCFAVALWNENDPILKERLFGLTGNEGNHGEDVKEAYFYLDSTPDHSYMRALYKYPQREFPYGELVAENRNRGRDQPEYELLDTGIFDENRYFDVVVEYAKAGPDDIVIRISATNHGPEAAPLHILPTLWFRNTWSWGHDPRRPTIEPAPDGPENGMLFHARHWLLGDYWLAGPAADDVLFTDNDSNAQQLWGVPNGSHYAKDGINNFVVHGQSGTVSTDGPGTKAAPRYRLEIAAGDTAALTLRLSHRKHREPLKNADDVISGRRNDADNFYGSLGQGLTADERAVQRQAYAGLLWSKQFFYFDVSQWLDGDPAGPTPSESRKYGRNSHWPHVNTADIISMPDSWEYPWFAAWDLAFHCVTFARIDPEFAKSQLILMLREWYMHPNGQIPAYEWAFGDVNPPVHAWAAWQVYKTEKETTGKADRQFLERIFHKLMLNFTWWVNRKDSEGRNVFQGGFLGLDNIGVFDRSAELPTGGTLEQSDATAWMAMFSLDMLAIALELARGDDAYEDAAIKFLDHFLYIAGAMNDLGGDGIDIWDKEEGFYYDVLLLPDGTPMPIKVRSLVGLMPLLAVEAFDHELRKKLPNFDRHLRWFLHHRPDLASAVPSWEKPGVDDRRLLALVDEEKLKRLLERMLDPDRFLSDHGIRSVSKHHEAHPYEIWLNGNVYSVDYEPGESTSGMFGGNSNWRGPIWFPINYLLVESLREYHQYYGDEFTVECPVGSGNMLNLDQVADELSRRLSSTFLRNGDGKRPVYGDNETMQCCPLWRDNILFYEYFHGDTGVGLGASHQTGWTGLVAKLLQPRRHEA
ncbi:MAG TPA: hypothetical protein VHG52_01895, partial [Thermomicrobiales bacterium]|nr:hypothetical protein [Thermomicrobiales bacterium]